MYSNVPNFNLVFGYTGASWTLKADLTARFAIRVITELDRRGDDFAVPAADISRMKKLPMVGFNSGYILRSRDHSPKQSDHHPWIVHQDYLTDRKILLKQPVNDGVLRFVRAGEWRVSAIQGMEAPEAQIAAE
jgi:monooxygenase